MGAVSAIAGTVVVVKMLEHADQPGVIEARGMIGLSFRQPSERLGQPLVLGDHAAGNEITAFGRFVFAQAEQYFVARVAEDQINSNKRCKTDDRVHFGVMRKRGGMAGIIDVDPRDV